MDVQIKVGRPSGAGAAAAPVPVGVPLVQQNGAVPISGAKVINGKTQAQVRLLDCNFHQYIRIVSIK